MRFQKARRGAEHLGIVGAGAQIGRRKAGQRQQAIGTGRVAERPGERAERQRRGAVGVD
jgi:hypothetical protein